MDRNTNEWWASSLAGSGIRAVLVHEAEEGTPAKGTEAADESFQTKQSDQIEHRLLLYIYILYMPADNCQGRGRRVIKKTIEFTICSNEQTINYEMIRVFLANEMISNGGKHGQRWSRLRNIWSRQHTHNVLIKYIHVGWLHLR